MIDLRDTEKEVEIFCNASLSKAEKLLTRSKHTVTNYLKRPLYY